LNLGDMQAVSDVANSSFLQVGGGTVVYKNLDTYDIDLYSSYNHLKIINAATGRAFIGACAVHGNFTLTDNTGQITLSNNIDVSGNLTVENSKVKTSGTLSVAGDVAVSGLADGSVLNVTLNGTAQSVQGSFVNLEIAAGSITTMTGDLTVENLVLVGALLNPDSYVLTVSNQTGIEAYKTQLQVAISGAGIYTEADYTVESWAALQTAVAGGQQLLTDENVTTVQLETAKNDINAAIGALVTNFSVLESWLNGIKAGYGNATVYTEATYSALQTAIAAEETFLAENTALIPAEVDLHKTAINSAIAALVRMTYTFYLVTGSSNLSFQNWNTVQDGTGIQAVAFSAENTGHTCIIPAGVTASSGGNSFVIYGSTLVLEEGATLNGSVTLHGSDMIINNNAAFNSGSFYLSGILLGDKLSTVRVKADGAIRGSELVTLQIIGNVKLIVEEGGLAEHIVFATYNDRSPIAVEVDGTIVSGTNKQLPVHYISTLTGSGTFITNEEINLSDAANSTFLQAGGGTLVYTVAAALLPSYNHLTIEDVTVAGAFVRTEEEATPPLTVYGNLLLRNNTRRVTVSNPIEVLGDFTVDYDIDDEAAVQAKVTVSGNVLLGGLLAEDNGLEITLSGDASHELSGAGATKLSVPAGAVATLAGDFSVEDVLTVNGVLDRNGRQLTFGSRGGDGVITDGTLAARLQELLDEVSATYPDGSAYTETSWAALAAAVEGGSALLGNDVPSEADDLSAAIAAIESAVAGLEIRTGIEGLSVPAVRVTGDASGIRIAGDAADVQVVTLTGAVRFRGRVAGDEVIALPAGVYIVAVNGTVRKVAVR
jgi:hypothetical protein